MANGPHHIADRKSWNSWNTCMYNFKLMSIFSGKLKSFMKISFSFNVLKLYFYSNAYLLNVLLLLANIKDGNRPAETAIEDVFIRSFMYGTWYKLFASEIIIKRQHNMIRIAGLIYRKIDPAKIYFLIGYTEELLSFWLHCPVKIELVSLDDRNDIIYKVI